MQKSSTCPFTAINFREEFWKEVVEVFAQEYFEGRTPSPCILCNEKLKFQTLYEKAKEIGAEKVCTGHYARIELDSKTNRYHLLRGKDRNKDQSYFLFSMTQEQLAATLFPLGEYTKPEIRNMAKDGHLITHNKPESQDICFIPDQDYAGFLKRHFHSKLPESGPIKLLDGTVVGQHEGIHTATIGKRKGLNVSYKYPLYVVKIEPKTNTIYVSKKEDCYFEGCVVQKMNWITQEMKEGDQIEAQIKIRSRGEESVGKITALNNQKALVHFEMPQLAVASGQAAVFYDGEKVIGGGWIEQSVKTFESFNRQELIAR